MGSGQYNYYNKTANKQISRNYNELNFVDSRASHSQEQMDDIVIMR